MRFIDKSERCQEFDDYVNENSKFLSTKGKWDLPTNIKTTLHSHLWKQQKGLCIYCEQEIHKKIGAEYLPKSLIEHIRPRTKEKYPELTYIFCNLSIACKKNTTDKKENIDFCEHKKGDEYDESKFLSPTELPGVESYFEYDTEGNIFPRGDDECAKYMIRALKLDHNILNDMRKNQFLEFSGKVLNEIGIEAIESMLQDEQSEQLPAFYSIAKVFISSLVLIVKPVRAIARIGILKPPARF